MFVAGIPKHTGVLQFAPTQLFEQEQTFCAVQLPLPKQTFVAFAMIPKHEGIVGLDGIEHFAPLQPAKQAQVSLPVHTPLLLQPRASVELKPKQPGV